MSPANKMPCLWRRCEDSFHQQHAILWPGISRTANLLAILNVSLFFLNGSVKSGGYYYPLVSLSLLAVAALLILLPLGQHDRLWYYLAVLMICTAAGWLLGASILYWLNSGNLA
jgi:hypothetical protein